MHPQTAAIASAGVRARHHEVSPYDTFRGLRHFGSLDGLRAIAIFVVIWHHGPGQTASSNLLRAGHEGVQLFFAISGFLITTLLLRERAATGDISLRGFYARRVLRIFPLYYTVLLVYVLLMLAARRGSAPFWHNLPYFLSYTSNWFVPTSAVFGFSWSLSTEEQFYCFWPWCEKYLPGKRAIGAMLGIIAGAMVIRARWSAVWIPNGSFVRTVGTHIALPICLGVLLAHLLHERRGFNAAFRLFGHPASPLASVTAACLVIQYRLPALMDALALTAVVASCVVRERHWLTPALWSRPFVHLGKISYGAYLLHGIAYNVVEAAGNRVGLDRHGLVEFAATVLLTMGLATVSFQYYESFFLGLKKRFEPVRALSAAA